MKTKNISARYVERAQQMVQNEESAKCRLQVHRKGALCVCVAVCSFCLCLCLNIRRPACISVVSTNNMICISNNPGGVRGEGGVVGGEGGERAALQGAPHRPDGEEQEGGGEQVGRGGC